MKKLVEHARSLGGQALSLGGTVAGAVRRAVDPPLGEDAKPLDIKRAIVEAVEQRLEPAGNGRRVLPGDGVQVKVLVEQTDARRALEAVLADVRDTVIARLLELHCTVPRWFAVDVSYVRRSPADWEAGQRLAVTVVPGSGRTAANGGDAEALPTLAIAILRGQTAQQEFTFTEPVVRIGRSHDPTDDRGRPRFNDVAFLENDSAENRTVTRGHAVIRYHAATAEYRLFDEGSANGTRVIRSGEVIDVPKRDPVGLALKSGDEVQLGKAAIRVRVDR
jgi:hypothetical protein